MSNENTTDVFEKYKNFNLESFLREAASLGDLVTLEELLKKNVNVNSQHLFNGWTPLHWACKRGNYEAVEMLLNFGADKTIKNKNGEVPAAVSSHPRIFQLLGTTPLDAQQNDNNQIQQNCSVPNSNNLSIDSKVTISADDDLILKLRIANNYDPDFIEVDLPRGQLTYGNLIELCCKELGVTSRQITKLRKLPNTKLRRDKDVARLKDYQEIEVVLEPSEHLTCPNGSILQPTNGYQSISEKNQTVLY